MSSNATPSTGRCAVAVSTLDNRFLAADPHHLHPDRGAPVVRHPRRLRAHRRWPSSTAIARGARAWAGSRTASGRIRRAPTSPASASASSCGRRSSGRTCCASLISIAVEVRAAAQRPAPLEPVELRRERGAVPGAGDGRRSSASSGATASGRWSSSGCSASVIVWRVGRLHISATYVASFLLFSFVRSAVTGNPWLASVAPITGPMYQLFIFFMVTDPKTTVRPEVGPVSSWSSSSRSSRCCCG